MYFTKYMMSSPHVDVGVARVQLLRVDEVLDGDDKRKCGVEKKRGKPLRSSHGLQSPRGHAKHHAAVFARVKLHGEIGAVLESLRMPSSHCVCVCVCVCICVCVSE